MPALRAKWEAKSAVPWWAKKRPRPKVFVVLAFVLPLLAPALSLLASSPSARLAGAASSAATPLTEFVNDGAGGRLWNAYDQTVNAAGPTIIGRPSPVEIGPSVSVFVHATTGDLAVFTNDGKNGRVWNSYDVSQIAGLSTITGDPAAVTVNQSSISVFAEGLGGDLIGAHAPAGSEAWTGEDLTQISGGPTISGDPAVVAIGPAISVFARSASGDLIQFVNDGMGGRAWNAYDLTKASNGPTLAGDPGAVVYSAASIHVYGQAPNGDLIEFVNDDAGGRLWNSYDLSAIAHAPAVTGRPSPVVYGATVHVYAQATNGDLLEVINDGAWGRLWNSYDLTKAAAGPPIVGDPGAVTYGAGQVHVYARLGDGDLEEFVNDDAGGRLWNSYDLTQASLGPAIGGDPSPLVYGTTVHVYADGPQPPAVIQAIVAAATSQDQYHLAVVEDPPGSNCNIYTAYWGRGTATGCAPGTRAEEWCSDFAEWVWAAAGINTAGINGWSFTFIDWGESHTGAFKPGATNDPQPGDAVVWGDLSSGYGAHVGIVVGVSQGQIDVVSGNSGPPIDPQGDVDAVWDSGWFNPATSTVDGYPIIGYVSPTNWTGFAPAAVPAAASRAQRALIATQDGGK